MEGLPPWIIAFRVLPMVRCGTLALLQVRQTILLGTAHTPNSGCYEHVAVPLAHLLSPFLRVERRWRQQRRWPRRGWVHEVLLSLSDKFGLGSAAHESAVSSPGAKRPCDSPRMLLGFSSATKATATLSRWWMTRARDVPNRWRGGVWLGFIASKSCPWRTKSVMFDWREFGVVMVFRTEFFQLTRSWLGRWRCKRSHR
jgi:hypothetical protein